MVVHLKSNYPASIKEVVLLGECDVRDKVWRYIKDKAALHEAVSPVGAVERLHIPLDQATTTFNELEKEGKISRVHRNLAVFELIADGSESVTAVTAEGSDAGKDVENKDADAGTPETETQEEEDMSGMMKKVYTQAEAREGWVAVSSSSAFEHLKQLNIRLPSQLVAAVNQQKTMVEEGEDPLKVLLDLCEVPPINMMVVREYYPAIEAHFTWLDHAIANKTLMSGFKPSARPDKSDNGSNPAVNAKKEVEDMQRAEKPAKEANTNSRLTWSHMMSRPNFKVLGFGDEAEFVQELVAYNGDCRGLVKGRSPNKFKLGRTPEMVERYCRKEGLLTAEGELTALAREKAGQMTSAPKVLLPGAPDEAETLDQVEASPVSTSANGDDLAKSMITMLSAATRSSTSVPLAPGIEAAARAAILRAPVAMLIGQFSSLLPFVNVAEKALTLIQADERVRKQIEESPHDVFLIKAADFLVQAGKLVRGNGYGA